MLLDMQLQMLLDMLLDMLIDMLLDTILYMIIRHFISVNVLIYLIKKIISCSNDTSHPPQPRNLFLPLPQYIAS